MTPDDYQELFAEKDSLSVELESMSALIQVNIATGETSQAITPFHFFDNFNFHH